MHIEFNCGFRFAGAHVAVGVGAIQRTRYQELFPGVRLLVQEDLRKREGGKRSQALDN